MCLFYYLNKKFHPEPKGNDHKVKFHEIKIQFFHECIFIFNGGQSLTYKLSFSAHPTPGTPPPLTFPCASAYLLAILFNQEFPAYKKLLMWF